MTSIKPKFPKISTGTLDQKLEQLEGAVKEARAGDKVDVAKLEAAIERTGDKGLADGLEAIKDSFSTYEQETRVDTACGGTYTVNRQIEPKTLDQNQVKSVFAALVEAKSRVQEHLGADGELSQGEARSAHRAGDDLAGELAESVIEGAASDFQKELRTWRELVTETSDKVDARQSVDRHIASLAEEHAETDLGAEALKWAFRSTAVDPQKRFDFFKAEEALDDAETSWLKHVPFFGGSARAQGHLSDKEIKKHLGTDDLAAFVAQKQEAVAQQVGDYDGYLAGVDLPDYAHLSDPDFSPINTGC